MGDYIGVKNLCSLCVHGEIKSEDMYGKLNSKRVVCQNKESKVYNCITSGIVCAPCFTQKKLEGEVKVEYVGFGD